MGIAEVIPGVSGGTIAFITGIYEQLIKSIKSIGPEAFIGFKNDGIHGLWKAIDGTFLMTLLVGMAMGFLAGVMIITNLIETQPEILWGFFFGLIIASSVLIGLEIKRWTISKFIIMLVGIGIAYYTTVAVPAEGSLNPIYVFLSAMIAISALMLPGVSGSFVLLILGMYTMIIPAIKRLITDFNTSDLTVVAIFGLGCLTGLAVFSRVLSWLFQKHKEVSFALLTGFMIGSLNKIWPWRNPSVIMDKDTGLLQPVTDVQALKALPSDQIKLVSESNVFPQGYLMGDPKTLSVIIAICLGIAIVYLLSKLNKNG